jgi:hypothetical protein
MFPSQSQRDWTVKDVECALPVETCAKVASWINYYT